jgi:hypothetical protein
LFQAIQEQFEEVQRKEAELEEKRQLQQQQNHQLLEELRVKSFTTYVSVKAVSRIVMMPLMGGQQLQTVLLYNLKRY